MGDLQKTNLGLQAKHDSVENYIRTHFKGFGEEPATPAPQTPAKTPVRVKTTPKTK